MNIDSILDVAKNLELKELLAYLVANGIKNTTLQGYEKVRDLIRKRHSEKIYAFVPDKNEATKLLKFADNTYYRNMKECLTKDYKYLDIIRTGYLIVNLNKIGGEPNRSRVSDIKMNIGSRPNGHFLLKVVKLVTTGAVVPVAEYLIELKNKGYQTTFIQNTFEEIIFEFEKYTIFATGSEAVGEIKTHVLQKIQLAHKLIMLFSYGSATVNTTKAVAEILNQNLKGDYTYSSKNNKEGEKDVHVSTFVLI